jgi:hypothetical protein
MAASMSVGFAAKISVIPQSSEQTLVMVEGDLLPSDVKQFKEATSFFFKSHRFVSKRWWERVGGN